MGLDTLLFHGREVHKAKSSTVCVNSQTELNLSLQRRVTAARSSQEVMFPRCALLPPLFSVCSLIIHPIKHSSQLLHVHHITSHHSHTRAQSCIITLQHIVAPIPFKLGVIHFTTIFTFNTSKFLWIMLHYNRIF